MVELPNQDLPKQSTKTIGFLEEGYKQKSAMRLMCFISLMASLCFAFISIFKSDTKEVSLQLSYTFLVAAFAPKAIQKFAELGK